MEEKKIDNLVNEVSVISLIKYKERKYMLSIKLPEYAENHPLEINIVKCGDENDIIEIICEVKNTNSTTSIYYYCKNGESDGHSFDQLYTNMERTSLPQEKWMDYINKMQIMFKR